MLGLCRFCLDFFYVPDFFYVFLKNQGKNDRVPTFFYVKVFRWTRIFSFQITNLTKSEWKKRGNLSEFHSERNYYLQNWYFSMEWFFSSVKIHGVRFVLCKIKSSSVLLKQKSRYVDNKNYDLLFTWIKTTVKYNLNCKKLKPRVSSFFLLYAHTTVRRKFQPSKYTSFN